MSKLGKFAKVPDDHKRYTIDYSEWLDGGETIASFTFEVAVNTTTTPLVVDTTAKINGDTAIEFYVGGGEATNQYDVLVEITTSDAQVAEDSIHFTVRSPV